jgi:hypothetical protein
MWMSNDLHIIATNAQRRSHWRPKGGPGPIGSIKKKKGLSRYKKLIGPHSQNFWFLPTEN